MAKVLLKRLWPERKIALDGVVYTDIYKADGEADIPAIGDPMTTPATCFTPLAYPIEFTKNHPDVPGKARLVVEYRIPSWDEWLLVHPGNAVLLPLGEDRVEGRNFHSNSAPVSGRGMDGGVRVHVFGNPSVVKSGGGLVLHGYTTTTTLAASLALHLGKKNSNEISGFPTGFKEVGAVYLAHLAPPLPVTWPTARFKFDVTFRLNNGDQTYESLGYTEAAKLIDLDDPDPQFPESGLRRELHVNMNFNGTTTRFDTYNFDTGSQLSNMLSGTWPTWTQTP